MYKLTKYEMKLNNFFFVRTTPMIKICNDISCVEGSNCGFPFFNTCVSFAAKLFRTENKSNTNLFPQAMEKSLTRIHSLRFYI